MCKIPIEDKRIYLSIFHDEIIREIDRIENGMPDINMFEYQIFLLNDENPNKYSGKISKLLSVKTKNIDKWKRNKKKIGELYEELSIYRKHLDKIQNLHEMKGGDINERQRKRRE